MSSLNGSGGETAAQGIAAAPTEVHSLGAVVVPVGGLGAPAGSMSGCAGAGWRLPRRSLP